MGWGVWKEFFFGDLANCGVVGHVPEVLLGFDCVHDRWVLFWGLGDR